MRKLTLSPRGEVTPLRGPSTERLEKDTEQSLSLGAASLDTGSVLLGQEGLDGGTLGTRLGDTGTAGRGHMPGNQHLSLSEGDVFSSIRTTVGFLSFIPTPKDYESCGNLSLWRAEVTVSL